MSGRAVYINSDNKIGTLVSTHRFKDEIKPMDKASEAILEAPQYHISPLGEAYGDTRNFN